MPKHRRHAARGANAPEARHRRCRVEDEDPREVPACARERGVRDAARAHVRQDASCAPTRRCSGSTRTCWSRSTAASYEPRDELETCRRSARRRAPRGGAPRATSAGRGGRGAGDPRRPWSLVIVACCVDRRARSAGEQRRRRRPTAATTTTTDDHASSTKTGQTTTAKPAADAGWRCGSSRRCPPTCAWTAGPARRWSSRARSPRRKTLARAPRPREPRQDRDVRLTANGKHVPLAAGPDPVGLRLHARAGTRTHPGRRATLRVSVRARGIVVTGTEVLTGRVQRPQRPVAGRPAARAGRSSWPTSRSAATGPRTWRLSCASWPTRAWT